MQFTKTETQVLKEAINDYKAKLAANTDALTIGNRDGVTLLEIYQDKFLTAQAITRKLHKNK